MTHETQAPASGAEELPAAGSGAMFDRIAHRYDLLNRILSGGGDRRWRRRAVELLAPADGSQILDLATGTGDLALAVLAHAPGAAVVGVDPSPQMLERAREKARRAGVEDRVELQVGAAEEIPADDASFDGACMGFGIRNVADRPRALRELARVIRPGGRLVILELSEPRAGLIAPLARWYIHRAVPRIGAILSGAREYRYLERSISAFPPPDVFAGMMAEAGFTKVELEPLQFGACTIFAGEREEAA
jgi:demethylmenaquinone methyltransferase / 2-methoxy-6-polyprenyl-1,4-benzoquinol methylase